MSVLTQVVARLLLLPSFLIAAGLLVKGYTGAGDGFSAGVVAGLGVFLQYLAFGAETGRRLVPPRPAAWGAAAGLVLILLIAFVPVAVGEPLLTHYPRAGEEAVHLGHLELHTALLFDVGVFLVVFGFLVSLMGAIAREEEQDA